MRPTGRPFTAVVKLATPIIVFTTKSRLSGRSTEPSWNGNTNMSANVTRDQIVEAADRLFYRNGFDHTSFSDIADAVKISRGNFYHHFKSKDEILDAVIAVRLASTREMLDRWEAEGKTPVDRIRSFIHMLIANRGEIKMHGCP